MAARVLCPRGEDRASRWARTWQVLLLAGGLVMLAGTPLPNFHSDSALYGRIAKNVLASGDWLSLQHQSGWIVDKPPLSFWLIAFSFRLGGVSDTTLRFWHVLMGLALVAVTYLIARLGAHREEALLAALILATMFQPFYLTLAPMQDVPLALFLALAFYAYLRYRADGKTGQAALVGLLAALAVLTKGILSLVAFVAIITADLLLARARGDRAGVWRWPQIAAAAGVFVAIAAPWFLVGAIRQGMAFVNTFFLMGSMGIGRLVIPKQSPIPYWLALIAYVPMLVFWMLPWTGFLPGTLSVARRSLSEGPPSVRTCAVWAGVYFLALSLTPGDKVYRLLHPMYPPLAVLAARYLCAAVASARRLRAAAVISLAGILVLVAGVAYLAGQGPANVRPFFPIVVPFLAVLTLTMVVFAGIALRGSGRLAVATLAGGAILAYGALEWKLMQTWEGIWPWRRVAATIHRLYQPGDRVMLVGPFNGEAQYMYYHLEVPLALTDDAALEQAWQDGRIFALLSPDSYARVRERFRPAVLVEMPVGWVLVTNR